MGQKQDLLSQTLECYMHCVVLVTFARERKEEKPLFKQTRKVTFRIITSLWVVFGLSTLSLRTADAFPVVASLPPTNNYSRLPITRTLANSNLALTRTNVDFPWISVIHSWFTVILPLITRTPANSNQFSFPLRSFST